MSKKLIKQLFNFLVVITNSTLFLHGLTQAEQKFVEKYAPPKELQTQLEQIFPDKDLISSLTQKSICGTTSTIQELQERIEKFEIIKTKHTDKLTEIICQHPQIPDFIIKIAASGHKYRNMTRVISASEMNEYLQIKNITNVIVPKKYLYQIPNTTDFEDENFIVQRILELSYSADDMRPFAEDLGYDGEPFPWNPDRRAILRAELDAYYAHLYGLNRDELRYILDPTDIYDEDFPSETFRVLKNKEIEIFGEYRTQKLVLESWDRFERDEVFGKHEVA